MYRTDDSPNFATFAAAARAGNSRSVVAFNPGVYTRILSVTPYEDYTAGETVFPERVAIYRAVDGKVDGTQVHVLSYLGSRWGAGEPRMSAEEVVKCTQDIRKHGGVITWDVPVQSGGLISQQFLDQLSAIGKALRRPAKDAARSK